MTSRLLCGLAGGLLVAVALAGCSATTEGTPQASSTGGASTKSTSPGSSTSRPSATAGPANVEPCELLSATDAAGLGLGTGKSNKVGNLEMCNWTASGNYSVAISLSNKGLDGLPGDTVDVGKHKAVQSTETGSFGGCGVIMGLSANSSVLVVVNLVSGGAAAQACPRAVEIAKIIDPKLP